MDANLEESSAEFGLPLYPRDFLHALPKPDNHVDNEYYFATPPTIVMSNYGFRQRRTEDEDRLILELYHLVIFSHNHETNAKFRHASHHLGSHRHRR